MIFKVNAILLCALPLLGGAGDGTAVGGPVPGCLYDAQARAIRPMIGFPGSAYIGDPLVGDLDAAVVAPDGSAALAVRQGQVYVISGLRTGSPVAAAVTGAIAAVYSSASGQAQVLRGLPANPAADDALDLSSLSGTLSALAVDRSGAHVLAGFTGDNGGVYSVASGAAPVRLAGAAQPSAIVLSAQEHDLYFADQARQQIWQVQSFDEQPAAMLFAEASSGVSAPVGIGLSADGTRLFVAESGSQALDVFDVSTRSAAARLNLEFAPDTVRTLDGKSLLLLKANPQGQDPYYVLRDTGADGAAVYFVPVGREQ